MSSDDMEDAIPDYSRAAASARPAGGGDVKDGKTVKVIILHMTEKGIKVCTEEQPDVEFWLPLSQIEVPDDLETSAETEITVPAWLARKHGLL